MSPPSAHITITFDAWVEAYQPSPNVIDDNAAYNGCMYETFGPELEHVTTVAVASPACIWTLVEGDEGLAITSGMHRVNRIGYFITQRPADSGVDIDVELDDIDDDPDAV